MKCAICGAECKNCNSLTQHIKKHNISPQEYYDTYVDSNTTHKCKYCGKIVTKFVNLRVGYAATCGIECVRHNVFKHIDIVKRNEKAAKTKLEKYGSATYNNLTKRKQTVSNRTEEQRAATKEKRRLTNQKNLGVDSPMQSAKVRETWSKNYFDKTGYSHQSHNPAVREKIKTTLLERYGTDNARKSPIIKEKIKNTKISLYGDQNHREKTIATNIERYGAPHPWSNHDIRRKCFQRYTYQGTNFDSSWELAFYIYHVDMGDLITYQPNIYFEFECANKKHRCFPDFSIGDVLYEVKGAQFIDQITGQWVDPYKTHNDEFYEAKHKTLIQNKVHIIGKEEIAPYLKYVEDKYGKNYLKQFRNNKTEKEAN